MATAASDAEILEQARKSFEPDYVPTDDESYMGDKQLDYFRMLLLETQP